MKDIQKKPRERFFARYEAGVFCQSPQIESKHLLLRLLREDWTLADRFLLSQELVWEKIKDRQYPQDGTTATLSVDMPLTLQSKRILAFAAQEADRRHSKHIGTGHQFVAIIHEKDCYAAQIIREVCGLELDLARKCYGMNEAV